MTDPLCPACQGRNVGRVGTGQYYCWECFIEFSLSSRGLRMFRVEADGELSRIEDCGPEGVIS
jgi:ribosomal protein L37AE/L43A